MINWHLETRLLKSLKPNAYNPRTLSKNDSEHLEKSIEKFGLIDKPIITKEGDIIGGHQRIKLLKRKRVKEVECWVPDRDLSKEEVDELCIRSNRNSVGS